ncbi:SH3 domain-containing protein [Solihabitans fulvus]|uniref:SH3 domain-containing protein n=1 Tax=Solihabitans fulvus TaxID=1892852 RepID=A0A5B2XE03_9PSEU|nr:SH3 domain-containing protein [Solihabitans fulvus]KAA2261927.1 SH3 domain-containing protein [Solihabitans fulvus]
MFKKLAAAVAVTGALVMGVLAEPAMASASEATQAAATPAVVSPHYFAGGRAVTGGPTLKVRNGPGASSYIVQTLSNGTTFGIGCYVWGDWENGTQGSTNVWYWASDYNGYVSAAYVQTTFGNPSGAFCDF